MTPLEAALREAIREVDGTFPDFDFIRPGGELRVDLGRTVDRVRVDLLSPGILRLQSFGIVTADALPPDALARRSTVAASSWSGSAQETLQPSRLLDPAHHDGLMIQTQHEDHPWAEVTFDPPVEVAAVHLRAIDARAAVEDRDVRVHVGSPGSELETVYDATERGDGLRELLAAAADEVPTEIRVPFQAVTESLALTITGEYRDARATMKQVAKKIPEEDRLAFVAAVNDGVLLRRSLEWTAHGPTRSFRFWSDEEKVDYVRFTASVAEALRELTPHVCFGYGAALAVVRDGDLIPHDDDLDLIVAFEPHEAATLPEAHARVEEFLRGRGFAVKGDFFGHRHVASAPGRKSVDVFSALFEGDRIAWYPGTRGALHRSTMFPPSQGDLLGVPCPLPAHPAEYLETIYGPGWSTPDPGFRHRWRKKDFADQAVAAPTATEPEPEPEPERRGWLARVLQSWR
ncbi:hypothetical protein [Aeromicrobium choanae]|uniref:LicD family protein n=1 Tax=Aeromicrobium choanae TaxID=1736691 RepID=A0A1T4Z7W3_9ACTN|nr:hypothetical protein [Aeromicrobium choanae]SKB09701.1 hypothetical protein SAMN06295964_2836 [Aeromicrobium choanae]